MALTNEGERRRERRKGAGEREDEGEERPLGFRNTVGRGRDGDWKISRRPFFSGRRAGSRQLKTIRLESNVRTELLGSKRDNSASRIRVYAKTDGPCANQVDTTPRRHGVDAKRANREEEQPSCTEYHDTRISGKERIDRRIGRHAA